MDRVFEAFASTNVEASVEVTDPQTAGVQRERCHVAVVGH